MKNIIFLFALFPSALYAVKDSVFEKSQHPRKLPNISTLININDMQSLPHFPEWCEHQKIGGVFSYLHKGWLRQKS